MSIQLSLAFKMACRTLSTACMLAVAVVVIGVPPLLGQDYLASAGTPTFTTVEPVELGFVNVANGNLHLEIPLISLSQRGKVPFVAKLVYDSRIWRRVTVGTTPVWHSDNVGEGLVNYSQGGWRLMTSAHWGNVFADGTNFVCNKSLGLFRGSSNNFRWLAPDGTLKYFPIVTSYNECTGVNNLSGDALAKDSSGYHMYVTDTTTTVFAPDGTQVYPKVKDANGNSFLKSTPTTDATDTPGRIPVVTSVSGNQTFYDVLNSQGTRSRYTVTTQTINVNTAFGQSGVTEYSGTLTVIQSVALPDGTSYSFSYDSGTTPGKFGLLTGVTLPTGGQVTYTHTTFADSYGNRNRWVASRATGGGTWTFAPQVLTTCAAGGNGCQQKVTITRPNNPNNDDTVNTFTLNNGAWKSQMNVYTGSVSAGTLERSSTSSWDYSNSCTGCTGAAYVRVLTETTTVNVPGQALTKQTTFTYDTPQTGNVTAVKEWGYFASTPPATPDREIDYTYLSNSSYSARNIIKLPLTVTVKNSAGTQLSQTKFTYDSTALTSVTGVNQHDDANYGIGNTVRGNVTLIEKWVAGTTYLATSLSYDTTGQLRQSTDPAGNSTTFSYSDNFFSDNGSNPPAAFTPGLPTNAHLTATTAPLIGTQTFGYYYGSGKAALQSDQNGVTSYFHYLDPLDRVTTSIDAGGGWQQYQYTSATQQDIYTAYSDAVPSTSCVSCRHDRMTLDTLVRVTRTSVVSDPSGPSLRDYTYDAAGRVATVSNPYRTTLEPTYGVSSSAFDGLGQLIRVILPDGNVVQSAFGVGIGSGSQFCSAATYGFGFPHLTTDEAGKKRLSWTDGLGRLIEVDEPNSSGTLAAATCYKYDALGNLTQVVQQAQTRSYSYDGLSRLLSSTTPEAGTNTFFYTTTSGALCSGNPNNVCRRTDARSITTTYTYDALNRLLTRTHSDGSPGVFLAYDQSTLWGKTLTNTKGRLSHETSSGNSERIYSYDATGRVLEQWECLPSNCGTGSFGTSIRYNYSGQTTEITYPSGRKISYSYNNAGRATQVAFTAANGQPVSYNYANNLAYTGPGSLSSLTLGNGLTETYGYNNRLQVASATVSSPTLTAINRSYSYVDAAGKNNGNVASIVDQLSPARSQTFGYDQLNRLATAVESSWNLSYGYDVYGNLLQQTVNSGSAPALNQAVDGNNHLVGFGYDAAGNMTSDGSHTYQYDPENRLKSLDTTGALYKYDSRDQRISKSVGGTATEYIILGSEVIARRNGSDWADMIYINGRLVAEAANYEDRILTQGTNSCSGCGQFSTFMFPSAAGYSGYVIRSGDKLHLRQWQSAGAHGGLIVKFSDNTVTNWAATDQDGYYLNNDGAQTTWHYRRVDLTAYAGKTLTEIRLVSENTTAAGAWSIYYTDIALFSTDGSVRPVYNRQTSISLTAGGSTGVTGRTYSVNHLAGQLQSPDTTTMYYHTDPAGSARMMSSVNGYPVWQATYLPFGYEYNPLISMNRYKFAGYEHDSESNLEYASNRYFASQYTRFMTPDPLAGSPADPQSLNRYSFARNNPLRFGDPDGLYPRDQHEFLTFVIAVFAGAKDPAGIAAGASAADNAQNAATCCWGSGMVTNFPKHFGVPDFAAMGQLSGFELGFALHLVEDIGDPNAPHHIFPGMGMGSRIGDMIAHIFLNIIGMSPDTNNNKSGGFAATWGPLGGKGSYPMDLIEYMRTTVNNNGLTIVGMEITRWAAGASNTVSIGDIDLSGATLIGVPFSVNGNTVLIWQLPGNAFYSDPNVRAIQAAFSLPGSSPLAEAYQLYLYQIGAVGGGFGGGGGGFGSGFGVLGAIGFYGSPPGMYGSGTPGPRRE